MKRYKKSVKPEYFGTFKSKFIKQNPNNVIVIRKILIDEKSETTYETYEEMSPFMAACELQSAQNGVTVRSLRIVFDDILDTFGGSI